SRQRREPPRPARKLNIASGSFPASHSASVIARPSVSRSARNYGREGRRFRASASDSFPEAPPGNEGRRSLQGGAVPGGAWDRGRGHFSTHVTVCVLVNRQTLLSPWWFFSSRSTVSFAECSRPF